MAPPPPQEEEPVDEQPALNAHHRLQPMPPSSRQVVFQNGIENARSRLCRYRPRFVVWEWNARRADPPRRRGMGERAWQRQDQQAHSDSNRHKM